MTAITVPDEGRLARPPGRPVGWWGVACLIATEATIFAGLLSAYFFLWAGSRQWPQGGIEAPPLGRISIFTVILLSSSIPVFVAERANRLGRLRVVRVALGISFVMGAAFLINQVLEYRELTFGWTDNAYTSIFFTTTGLHGLHVLLGLLMNLVVQAKGYLGRLGSHDDITVEVFSLYWHFVDAVWIFVFTSLYLAPHFR
jgi:cytochrome c oxidase subunit III